MTSTSTAASRPRGTGPGRRLVAALAAADRGWPVFPVHPYSKYPAVADWENRATRDPEALAAWWAVAPYNIGIACGPAGLLVVDLDAAHGHTPPPPWNRHGVTHGRDVLDILARQAGAPPTGTYTVTTPTGGEHRYFLTPPGLGLRNTTGSLGWHIDTRAAGGNIIAAGSIRRIGDRVRFYTVTNPGPPAPLPDWLTTSLTPAPTTPASPSLEPLHLPADRINAYTRAALDGEVRNVVHALTGTRNTTLFKAAANLGELIGAGVLDEAIATDALRQAARVHHGVEKFTPREADRTIANGLARGRQQPRRITGHLT